MSCKFLRILRPRTGIYTVNRSTVVDDAEVTAWCSAVQRQIARDAAPAWHRKPVPVKFLTAPDHAPAGAWVIAVVDDADQAGALGYHSEDAQGRPYGRVFAKTCLDYQVVPSTCFSHEVLETFGDPSVDAWADTGRGYSVPRELCDAVEGGSYDIDGVQVSDFLFPAWFAQPSGQRRRTRLNFRGTLTEPFQLEAGGYTVRRFPDGTQDQEYGPAADRGYIAAKRHALSRTTRRTS